MGERLDFPHPNRAVNRQFANAIINFQASHHSRASWVKVCVLSLPLGLQFRTLHIHSFGEDINMYSNLLKIPCHPAVPL